MKNEDLIVDNKDHIEIKYGLVAVEHKDIIKKTSNYGVIQFIGFDAPPTMMDYINTYKELNDQFGLGNGIVLLPADANSLKHFKEIAGKGFTS